MLVFLFKLIQELVLPVVPTSVKSFAWLNQHAVLLSNNSLVLHADDTYYACSMIMFLSPACVSAKADARGYWTTGALYTVAEIRINASWRSRCSCVQTCVARFGLCKLICTSEVYIDPHLGCRRVPQWSCHKENKGYFGGIRIQEPRFSCVFSLGVGPAMHADCNSRSMEFAGKR